MQSKPVRMHIAQRRHCASPSLRSRFRRRRHASTGMASPATKQISPARWPRVACRPVATSVVRHAGVDSVPDDADRVPKIQRGVRPPAQYLDAR